MGKGTDIPRMRWLLTRSGGERPSVQYSARHAVKSLLTTAVYEGLRFLPIDACSALSAMMAKTASRTYAQLDARARENLKQIRPEQSDPASIDLTMSRLWRSVARTRAEVSVLDRLWRVGRIAVEGVEHWDAARAANRPILGVSFHLGNWEAMGVVCQRIGHPVTVLFLPEDTRFERLRSRVQKRYGAILIPAGSDAMRTAVRILNQKTSQFGIFIDEVFGGRQSAPAFGRPLRPEGNIAFAARLAWLTNAEVIPAYCLRIDDQARFKMIIHPPIELVREGDRDSALLTNISRINAVVEAIVRPHLDQWASLLYRPVHA